MADGDARRSDWVPVAPPWSTTAEGRPRRVGVEIELIGLEVEPAARKVAAVLGGETEPLSAYEVRVRGGADGDWRVELDLRYLKEKGRERAESGGDEDWVESVVRQGAQALVPVEVVSPPLPFDRLAVADAVAAELRASGAQGTSSGLIYAFGLHLNFELPRLDAATITSYLKAFLCLYDWLVRRCGVDLTRRLSGYVQGFSREYVQRVVRPDYAPDLATLIDDYLAANPTRNRALDMLPLFTELDADRVRRRVQDERVQARPALHYRLPNSEIDEPAWGVHEAWDDWLAVERLAAAPERLAELGERYTRFLESSVNRWLESWADETEEWLASAGDR